MDFFLTDLKSDQDLVTFESVSNDIKKYASHSFPEPKMTSLDKNLKEIHLNSFLTRTILTSEK